MSIDGSLREALILQRPVLVQDLDSNTVFLTYLAKFNLIQPEDVSEYQAS